MFKIVYSEKFNKSMKKIPKDYHQKIKTAIHSLAVNPYPSNSLKMTNCAQYRIRIGVYRLLYEILKDKLIIQIIDIGHRQGIY